jgi:hypothetical protein
MADDLEFGIANRYDDVGDSLGGTNGIATSATFPTTPRLHTIHTTDTFPIPLRLQTFKVSLIKKKGYLCPGSIYKLQNW